MKKYRNLLYNKISLNKKDENGKKDIIIIVIGLIVSIMAYYERANWVNDFAPGTYKDDLLVPLYSAKYTRGHYFIRSAKASKKNKSEKWKRLPFFFSYKKPFRHLRVRAYLLEIFAQIYIFVSLILFIVMGSIYLERGSVPVEFLKIWFIYIIFIEAFLAAVELDIVMKIYNWWVYRK